ncbi:MAG: hypothetical protein ACYTGC_16455 [Planctomycetota bacterium]|jgi:hypothetical protein
MIPRPSLARWADHLRSVATSYATADAPLSLGTLDQPVRAAFGASGAAAPPVGAAPATAQHEEALWWAISDGAVDVDCVLAPRGDGALLPRADRAIEVWTEADLCALHALWRLAHLRARPDWLERLAVARDWHLQHTQPDNATNRPWALHVFLLAQTPESIHYAETLLHNALALQGRPEPLSAWILVDAAAEIQRAISDEP